MGGYREIIDATLVIRPGMPVWPGDDGPRVKQMCSMTEGAPCNLSTLTLSAHTGTHVDAPRHFIDGGATLETLTSEILVGEVIVVNVASEGHVTPESLAEAVGEARPVRLALKTANTRCGWLRSGLFNTRFAALTAEAGRAAVSLGLKLLLIDGPSVDPYEDSAAAPAHRALLGAGTALAEWCDLTDVQTGIWTVVCSPLRWDGVDGAPARVWFMR